MSKIRLKVMVEGVSVDEAGTVLEQVAQAVANAGETEGYGTIGEGRYAWFVEEPKVEIEMKAAPVRGEQSEAVAHG